MKGFSITLCFGKYAGFYITTSSRSTRICLGWFALTIYWQNDIEAVIEYLQARDTRKPIYGGMNPRRNKKPFTNL